MIKIKYNGKEYDCPTQWSEVTVGMLIKASELGDMIPNAPIIAIAAAYTGIPIEDLKVSKVAEVNKIMKALEFISEPFVPVPSNEFSYKNEYYYCADDIAEQKFEDWVSVQTALYNYKDSALALPRILAIMCKKSKETLDDFEISDRAKEFESLPMTTAKNVEAFFLHSRNAYSTLSLLSSTQDIQETLVFNKLSELKDTMKRLKAVSGTSFFTRLQIGTLQLYLWYLKKQLVKYYNSTRLEQ